MTIDREYEFLIYLISKTIKGETVSKLPSELDYTRIFSIAKKSNVFTVVSAALDRALLPAGAAAAVGEYNQRETRKQNEASEVLRSLESKGVSCLPLDGFVLSDMYPAACRREITDFNIMTDEAGRAAAEAVMTSRGYNCHRRGVHIDCYKSEGRPNIFIHDQNGGYEDYLSVWNEKTANGRSSAFGLSNEMRYICILARVKICLDKNRNAVKAMTDFFIFKYKLGAILNNDYIALLLGKYHLSETEKIAMAIYNTHFNRKTRDDFYIKYSTKLFAAEKKQLPAAAEADYPQGEKHKNEKKEKTVFVIPFLKNLKIPPIYIIAGAIVAVSLIAAIIIFDKPSETASGDETTAESALYEGINFDNDLYFGETSDGLPNGDGEMQYGSGDIYEGRFENGKKHGYGLMNYANGTRYEGYFSENHLFGEGTFYFENGDILTGNFENDLPHGQCVITYTNGNIYDGEYVGGKRTGEGLLKYSNGDEYSGTFDDGIRSGYGIYRYANGSIYEGSWSEDLQNGEGKFIAEPEFGVALYVFEGTYADGQMVTGTISWKNGDQYNGKFKDNKRDDTEATFTYENGTKYVGGFSNNVFNGFGTLSFKDGDIVKGTFVNGKIDGDAEYFHKADNKWSDVKYNNGEIVN